MIVRRIDYDLGTGLASEVPLDALNRLPRIVRPPVNHIESRIRRSRLRLTSLAPTASLAGFTIATLEQAYRSGAVRPGFRRELLGRLRRLQRDLDRQYKRRFARHRYRQYDK